ncbi:MAG: flagellar filament capping protein FliD [Aliarcobacter sp.]|jgi:flagellar hook-associated protein 2|nr:flagellar filament capping protein FliD [Aliarcobacter sp.]
MATGVLGLGSGQAASLNSDLIEKLKTAERKSAVEPIETRITKIGTEKTTFSTIEAKVAEFLETVKPFDLFISGGVNAFEQKGATTSGDSVTFDAADAKSLSKGFTSVDVTQLAQKDVYQSNNVTEAVKNAKINQGSLVINGQTFDTTNKSYQELATEISAKSGMIASVEQVGTDSFRLIVKSEETGVANKLNISGAASQALGFTTDGTAVNATNHILEAKNMVAKVDGVEYNVASNSLTVDGLKITANKLGVSSITIADDTSQLETQMKNFVTKYNELLALVDNEVYNSDSALDDKSSIRSIMTQIKDKLFGSYGPSSDKSLFNYGVELDKYGALSLNTTKFNSAVQSDLSGLKDLFIGSAEKKGLGTILKETVDEMRYVGGTLNSYQSAMANRETKLEEEKAKAEKALNAKYEQLALQFSSYGAIINQMESSFSGLKMLIQQSTSGN